MITTPAAIPCPLKKNEMGIRRGSWKHKWCEELREPVIRMRDNSLAVHKKNGNHISKSGEQAESKLQSSDKASAQSC